MSDIQSQGGQPQAAATGFGTSKAATTLFPPSLQYSDPSTPVLTYDLSAAKAELAKRWGTFRTKDRQDCVEQGITPSPSYVEVLTCLEMNTDAIKNAPRVDGKPVPQIGGPVAPGLDNGPAPKT